MMENSKKAYDSPSITLYHLGMESCILDLSNGFTLGVLEERDASIIWED